MSDDKREQAGEHRKLTQYLKQCTPSEITARLQHYRDKPDEFIGMLYHAPDSERIAEPIAELSLLRSVSPKLAAYVDSLKAKNAELEAELAKAKANSKAYGDNMRAHLIIRTTERDRLKEYVQRDLDCECKPCPVDDCVECQYYNTIRGARKALAITPVPLQETPCPE